LTWKSYQVDLPYPGFLGLYNLNYMRRHNPLIDFTDACTSTQRINSVPFTQLAADITNKSTPNYAYITPNADQDAHNGTLAQADQWLQHVVVFGSGAALFGSPLSGGYAGAKKMNAFIAEYAAGVASRAKRSITFHCLIPPMSPHTEFGAAAARAYAQMTGQSFEDFVKQLPSPPTPADIGASVVALHQSPKKWNQVSYRVSADGMAPVRA